MLNHKRSNAINIGMTKLPPPRSIKTAILKMDATIMNREGIEVRKWLFFKNIFYLRIIITFKKLLKRLKNVSRIFTCNAGFEKKITQCVSKFFWYNRNDLKILIASLSLFFTPSFQLCSFYLKYIFNRFFNFYPHESRWSLFNLPADRKPWKLSSFCWLTLKFS